MTNADGIHPMFYIFRKKRRCVRFITYKRDLLFKCLIKGTKSGLRFIHAKNNAYKKMKTIHSSEASNFENTSMKKK